MTSARTGPTDRCSTVTGGGGLCSSDLNESTMDCACDSWDSIRLRCAAMTSLRAGTSVARSTARISSSGIPRSRSLRMTCAVANWPGW
jgi:hypothetical protein